MIMLRFLLIQLLLNVPLHAGWLDRKAEGWAWYEEKAKKQKEEPENDEIDSAVLELEAVKKQLEELKAEALLYPTEQNMVAYMEAQKEWLHKSAVFSNQWERILLARPDLDPTATTFATTYYGRLLQKTAGHEERTQFIQSISKEYGLFFFYEGSKKPSQAFSKVVKILSEKYHWPVVSISVDGIPLEGFISEHNGDLAEKFGIAVYPALLAFEPGTRKIIPLSFGLKSLEQVEQNIYRQLKNE